MNHRNKKPTSKPEKADRPPRVPMSRGLSLTFPKNMMDPNYHYHWFQDRGGRIQEAVDAWYEFVTREGHRVKQESGEYPLFLMRIEKKYWEEDQKLHLEAAQDKMNEAQHVGDGEYLPDGRHHVIQKDENYDPLG